MQSPKFPHKAKHLKTIISASVLQQLWRNHVRDKMRRQVIPDAVEFLDFHVQLKQRCSELESTVCSGSYLPRPVIRLKVEKGKGLCRQVSLPSPEDALLLQALANALWKEIGPKSPSKNSFFAQEDQAFSKANKDEEENEFGYGPIESWLDFQKTLLGFSQTRKFVVVTDVANYYDFILHSFLRAILSDYANEREHALDLLIFSIDSMLWRPDYMPNYGIGLPQMDFDAPRLLAHTHLFEIDEIFSKRPGVDFARYMDDMDFGVDSKAAAKEVLRDLDLALQTRNLRLNSGKTKILTAAEAQAHFRATDNSYIDALEKRIALAQSDNDTIARYRAIIGKLIEKGLRSSYFDAGNGDKILKRLLRLATGLDSVLSLYTFRSIIYNKPSIRLNLLRHWSKSADVSSMFPAVIGFLLSGEAVDDYSRILIARALVEATLKKPIDAAVWSDILSGFSRTDPYQLFCRLWLISRYGTVHELKSEIDATNLIWSRYTFLCRIVAGFYGVFLFTPHFLSFEASMRKWGGPSGVAIMEFHERTANEITGYDSIKSFIKADNQSLPNRITHSKALMLASMLWNGNIKKVERGTLLGKHSPMMQDEYYRAMFSNIITSAP